MVTRASWVTRLQEHPGRPQGRQRRQLDALTALAGLLDARSGEGNASLLDVAKAAGVGERTARRALAWAKDAGLIEQTTRGRGHGTGKPGSSAWQLTADPRLAAKQGRQAANSDRLAANSQRQAARAPTQAPKPSGRRSSRRQAAQVCAYNMPVADDGTCCAQHAEQARSA